MKVALIAAMFMVGQVLAAELLDGKNNEA